MCATWPLSSVSCRTNLFHYELLRNSASTVRYLTNLFRYLTNPCRSYTNFFGTVCQKSVSLRTSSLANEHIPRDPLTAELLKCTFVSFRTNGGNTCALKKNTALLLKCQFITLLPQILYYYFQNRRTYDVFEHNNSESMMIK